MLLDRRNLVRRTQPRSPPIRPSKGPLLDLGQTSKPAGRSSHVIDIRIEAAEFVPQPSAPNEVDAIVCVKEEDREIGYGFKRVALNLLRGDSTTEEGAIEHHRRRGDDSVVGCPDGIAVAEQLVEFVDYLFVIKCLEWPEDSSNS